MQGFQEHYEALTGTRLRQHSDTPPGTAKKETIKSWVKMKGEVLSSAKTLAIKAQVLEWMDEDPDVKLIIYSQFIDMLSILGRVCDTEGWEYCRYDGKMSHDQRARALEEFEHPDKKKQILLMSLKAGGVGLNLIAASRVISVDPWWNASVEQQAFCRIFRIGQLKETKMTRLAVKGAIDEAMIQLQLTKLVEIDAAMDDSSRRKILTVKELMSFFGEMRKDEDGHAFVFAQQDVRPEFRAPILDSSDEDEGGRFREGKSDGRHVCGSTDDAALRL
jgi:SNF2 family DNA or RNA helicase